MSVIYVLVPAALVVVLVAVIAFLWAARRGEFDDLETPAVRMLHDDEPPGEDAGPVSARRRPGARRSRRPR
jgi:cbb3-type cytochrome oxidase maturation protein